MSDDRAHRDFLEKVFFENYKKEIDQEENVWRTLPFFSATVAFEITAIIQIIFRIDQLSKPVAGLCLAVILIFVLFLGVMLTSLWHSIRKREFTYPGPEIRILDYVIEEEGKTIGANASDRAEAIRVSLQNSYIEQWAASAYHNRRVNQLRAQFRERAALFLLLSIAALLILIICVALDPLSQRIGKVSDVTPPTKSGSQESRAYGSQRPKIHNF